MIKNYPTWYLKIPAIPPNPLYNCIPSSVSVEISSTLEPIFSAIPTRYSIKSSSLVISIFSLHSGQVKSSRD